MHRPHLRNEGLPAIVAGCTWSQATSWMLPIATLRQAGRHCDLFVPGRGSGCALPKQPAGRMGLLRSKWIPQVRGFVDDIVNAPGVESARRLFLFAATGTFVFVSPGSRGIGRPRSGSWNRPMVPMSGAKSPRFRPRSRVLSRRSRSQITNPSRSAVKAGGSRLPCAARPRRGERRGAAVSSRQYRRQPAHARSGDRTGFGCGCRCGRRAGPRQI